MNTLRPASMIAGLTALFTASGAEISRAESIVPVQLKLEKYERQTGLGIIRIDPSYEKSVPTIPSPLKTHLEELTPQKAQSCLSQLDVRIREAINGARATATENKTKPDFTEALRVAKDGQDDGQLYCMRFMNVDEKGKNVGKAGCVVSVTTDAQAIVNGTEYKALSLKTSIKYDYSIPSIAYIDIETGDLSASVGPSGKLSHLELGEAFSYSWRHTKMDIRPEDRAAAGVVLPSREELKQLTDSAIFLAQTCPTGAR